MLKIVRFGGPILVLFIALIATLIGLALGGGAAPQNINDPGVVIRYGIPFAKLTLNLGAAGMLGALVLALFAIPKGRVAWNQALNVATISAVIFTCAATILALLTFASVSSVPIDFSPSFADKFLQYLTTIDLGTQQLTSVLLGVIVTVLCAAVRNWMLVAAVTVLAVVAILPLAAQGHAAGRSGHNLAVMAIAIHISFAAIWLGGLVTIVVIRVGGTDKLDELQTIIQRYSSLALFSFIAVAISGVVSAVLRLNNWSQLASPYGLLIVIKTLALLLIGTIGAIQRLYLQRRIATRPTWFKWFVFAELAVMGIATGMAATLASTPQPANQSVFNPDPSPAQILTGEPLPPNPEWFRYFTEWQFDLLWTLICAFTLFFYLAGTWRLHRRGDHWPAQRTVFWCVGILVLFYVTNGGVNRYEPYLFSTHMLGHMLLSMAIPVLLVPGAPITLALRTIIARRDGSNGPREWILLVVQSRFARVVTQPIVTAVLFAASLWVFYYSPLFRWANQDHLLGHQWMLVHFLIVGYLFVQNLIGIDPVPARPSYPMRLIILLATMALHAFFGLALTTGTGLLLADWYGAMGWGVEAITDQQLGGGIAWSVGEIPTLALAITVVMLWSRSDERDSRRQDRHADRTGNQELLAYNENLQALAVRDRFL